MYVDVFQPSLMGKNRVKRMNTCEFVQVLELIALKAIVSDDLYSNRLVSLYQRGNSSK